MSRLSRVQFAFKFPDICLCFKWNHFISYENLWWQMNSVGVIFTWFHFRAPYYSHDIIRYQKNFYFTYGSWFKTNSVVFDHNDKLIILTKLLVCQYSKYYRHTGVLLPPQHDCPLFRFLPHKITTRSCTKWYVYLLCVIVCAQHVNIK